MLNFLRKLRRPVTAGKLEMKNTRPTLRVGRYLKYALGEIVLVVIGILIALSINNWNERNKARTFELKMLGEISAALGQDLPIFQRFDSLLGKWNQSTIFLTNEVNKNNTPSRNVDSIRFHLNTINRIGLYYIINDGPYEALKSSGIDKISNDRLRNNIAKLYSRDLEGLEIWINSIQRENLFIKDERMNDLFDIQIKTDGQDIIESLVLDNLSFLNDPSFYDLVNSAHDIFTSTRTRMKRTADKMVILKDSIEAEIRK